MTNFYNSGLYMEPFFTKHKQSNIMSGKNIFDNIDYNYELFVEYHKESLEYNDEKALQEQVHELFCECLSYYPTYFEPIIFKEQIAFECDLTPFTVDGVNLLALSGYGMDLSPRLDAYQALTDNSIDEVSYLFKDTEYFKSVVGKSLTTKVANAISCHDFS